MKGTLDSNTGGFWGTQTLGGLWGGCRALGMLLSSLIPSCSPQSVCMRLLSRSHSGRVGRTGAVGGPGGSGSLVPSLAL